jgi:transposase
MDRGVGRGLTNRRIESVNTKTRQFARIADGFTSPNTLIALAMLSLRGHKPTLPGRK